MKDRKTVICSAFKYVVPSDYEKWFEDLAAGGWHPEKVGQWNSLVMHFKKGQPKKYRYVIDMQPFPKTEYKQTYQDFGWEFVGQMASAFVWRREYEGTRPESFSDKDSVKARNRRFLGAVSVSFIMFLVGTLGFTVGLIFGKNDVIDTLQFAIAAVVSFAATILLGLVMKKIRKNIER